MPGSRAAPSHRAEGSWTPRLAGVAVVVVLAGGVLAIYLATARQQSPAPAPKPSPHHGQALKVVKVQTIGVIDFGPDDNGDPGQANSSSHALMLLPKGHEIDFVSIPPAVVISGKAVWTANQMSDDSEIFIYVPSGKCLAGTAAGHLNLTRCKPAADQRWRPVNSRIVKGQAINQYKNVETGECLTAPGSSPGQAFTTSCGPTGSKTQEIAFWWSA
jgi:hypothetical protein